MSLSSARQLAVSSVQKAQKHNNKQYDKGAKEPCYRVEDKIFVKFPAEETGKNRKCQDRGTDHTGSLKDKMQTSLYGMCTSYKSLVSWFIS